MQTCYKNAYQLGLSWGERICEQVLKQSTHNKSYCFYQFNFSVLINHMLLSQWLRFGDETFVKSLTDNTKTTVKTIGKSWEAWLNPDNAMSIPQLLCNEKVFMHIVFNNYLNFSFS